MPYKLKSALAKTLGVGACSRIFALSLFAGIAAGQSGIPNYQPITPAGRLDWMVVNTVGPASLVGGAISSAWGTLLNHPHEYGTHWDGFAERYGMRLTGIATSNTMEAGLGALWKEDPRYFRDEGKPFGHRVTHVIKMTFLAENSSGRTMPAYARFAAVSGSARPI